MASDQSHRWKVLAALGIGFIAGVCFGAWRMMRAPIDEYHATRIDIEETLAEMKEGDADAE